MKVLHPPPFAVNIAAHPRIRNKLHEKAMQDKLKILHAQPCLVGRWDARGDTYHSRLSFNANTVNPNPIKKPELAGRIRKTE